MKNAAQVACEESAEFLRTIRDLKHKLEAAKRLPGAEMAGELCAIQVEFGAFETQVATCMRWVALALTTAQAREMPTLAEVRQKMAEEIQAAGRTGVSPLPSSEDPRHVGMFPEHCEHDG